MAVDRLRAWLALALVSAGCLAAFFWLPPLGRAYEAPKHLLAFGLWSVTLAMVLRAHGATARGGIALVLLVGLVASAIGEGVQVFTPQHSPEWRGFAWSCAGVMLGAMLVAVGWRVCGRASRA